MRIRKSHKMFNNSTPVIFQYRFTQLIFESIYTFMDRNLNKQFTFRYIYRNRLLNMYVTFRYMFLVFNITGNILSK